MRRLLLPALSLVLGAGLGLTATGTAAAAPAASADIPTTKVVTAPIEIWKASAAQTPGGPPDYCAVTAFVVFPDVSGFEAEKADYTLTFGTTTSPTTYAFPEPPYDDAFTWGPLSRPAPAGRHQVVLGGQPYVWQAGSPDCEAAYAKAVATYPTTAQVTYAATERCAAAIDALNAARKALTKAKRRLANATTAEARATAAAKVRAAKADLARARTRYERRC